MFRRIRKRWLIITVAVLLSGAIIVSVDLVGPGLRTDITVERKLVEAGIPDAIMLVYEGAPLEDIKAAVEKGGRYPGEIASSTSGSLLFQAVSKRRIDVARWLIDEGVNPNGVHAGMPLVTAIRRQDIAMVKLLIAAGADPDINMGYGSITPRTEAESAGNPEILALLPPRKAKPSASSRAIAE